MPKGFEIKRKYLILFAVCGLIICLDQVTKLYIHTGFRLGEEVVVIENFFSLTYVRNYGAAFGFLGSAHEGFREVFFLVIPPLALLIILAILRGIPDTDRLSVLALSGVAAGAIGNYIDRLRFGYVIDFLDFYIPQGAIPTSILPGVSNDYPAEHSVHWPAFNVADMAIVCGIGVIFYLEWTRYRQTRQAEIANRGEQKA